MKKIHVFDFDGTLTLHDSMMKIIVFHCGWSGLIVNILRILHLIILMKLGLYSNHRTKEKLLDHCFGGMSRQQLDDLFSNFASQNMDILDKEYTDILHNAISSGDDAIVVTASPRMWVEKFLPGITVLGTELSFDGDIFNGTFSTPNCYGQEKVNRLLFHIPSLKTQRDSFHITAYGDSRGDREMLAFADVGVFK